MLVKQSLEIVSDYRASMSNAVSTLFCVCLVEASCLFEFMCIRDTQHRYIKSYLTTPKKELRNPHKQKQNKTPPSTIIESAAPSLPPPSDSAADVPTGEPQHLQNVARHRNGLRNPRLIAMSHAERRLRNLSSSHTHLLLCSKPR